jgi:hypothetical protein
MGGRSGGKITVLRAGPGFHEQKEYDIGPDGQITEVTTSPPPVIMEHDACKDRLLRSGNAYRYLLPVLRIRIRDPG